MLHWAKAPRGSGTIWCDVPDPLPALLGPHAAALEKLFGVKPAVKPAAGKLQFLHLGSSAAKGLFYEAKFVTLRCSVWCHTVLRSKGHLRPGQLMQSFYI